MSNQSYLAKFGIDGWAINGHHYDPCPVSGRCGVCGLRPEVHPIGTIERRAK